MSVTPLKAEKTTIKAVTFDLWETLIFERDGANARRTESRCRHLANALNRLGVDIQPQQLTPAFEELISKLLKIWDTNIDVSHVDQLQLIIRIATNGTVTLKQEWINTLTQAYTAPLFEVPPYLNPDARPILQQLKNQDKPIGLICNTGLTPGIGLRKFLENQGVAQYFDTMTFTDEAKIRKPDPKIFHLTAQKLNVKPNEAIHVGDNVRTDVSGANGAGFKAILLASQEGRDLAALSDPTSLVSRSRNIGQLEDGQTHPPDKTITSLRTLLKAIEELNQ